MIGSFTISHLGRLLLLGHRDTFSHPLHPVREDHAITLTKVSSCALAAVPTVPFVAMHLVRSKGANPPYVNVNFDESI